MTPRFLALAFFAPIAACAATSGAPADSGVADVHQTDASATTDSSDANASDVVQEPSTPGDDAGAFSWFPGNYVLLNTADDATTERDAVLASTTDSVFTGLEKRYDWVASEGAEGDYSQGIANIASDLAAVDAAGKKLLVFLVYKTFTAGQHTVPSYMLSTGPWCSGTTCGEVAMSNGVTAMIWLPGVATRLHAWIAGLATGLLGTAHIGALAGIVFPETACSGCDTTNTAYDQPTYLMALEANATATVAAFPTTLVFQYINFFPPNNTANQYLVSYANFALATPHVGVGCPDLAPLFDPPEYAILESSTYQGRVPMAPAVENPDFGSGRASPEGGVAATYSLGIDPSSQGGMGAQIISWSNANDSTNVFTLDDVAAYITTHANPNTAPPTW
jgi:hypothetical protein